LEDSLQTELTRSEKEFFFLNDITLGKIQMKKNSNQSIGGKFINRLDLIRKVYKPSWPDKESL
jgi:hypothetical protein